ncbi:MAG TPA: glycosyltransferase family 39 protein [Vicinamibacterales bacterium]|nr:glycosyltransferase family 39 protein [Vicinamibacterales bacterium]
MADSSWLRRYGVLVALPLAKLAIHLATIAGYGYFRDELYYVAGARRLAFGYVDHPPLSLLLLRPVIELFGTSLWSIRLLPAIAGAVMVLLVGLIARELGGGRFAQAIAMTAAIAAPIYLALDHIFSMNAFDLVVWAAAALVVIRLVRAPSPRLWLALGAIVGVGLQNKISVLWLVAGLGAGLLLTERRAWLRTRGPYVAAALAALIFLPYVIWQIAYGFPTIEFMANAGSLKMAPRPPAAFLLAQLEMMNPASAPLWIGGLAWLLAGGGRPYRLLGVAWLVVLAILLLNGTSRAYYLGPAYTWLFAAGGVWLEALTAVRLRWLRPAVAGAIVLVALVLLPFALPVLPVERYVAYAAALGREPATEERHRLSELPQHYADMHGWEAIVDAVEQAWRELPDEERGATVVLAQNYGEAGAVEVLGAPRGLPPAISGHNSYWMWGPPDFEVRNVIVIDGDEDEARDVCTATRIVAHTDCGYCMPYEDGNPVMLCLGLRVAPAAIWPSLKHFN